MSSSSDEEVVVRNPYSITTSSGQRSSRRSRVTREQELKSRALEEMKRARDRGGVHRVDVANLIKPVYDEVDEEEYMKIVQEWQKDNFVVDDDGSGYVDRGVDIFDEEQPSTTKKPKKSEEKNKKKRKAIGDFFHALNTKKVKEENTVSVANDPEVEALINECDLSKFIKEDQIKEVGCLETNNASLISSQCCGPERAVKFESKSKEISEHGKRLDEVRLQPSLITDGGNSTKLELIFQENAERNSTHISIHADNSANLHCAINKYAKDCIVEEVGQTETSFKWADCESETESLNELMKGSLVASVDTFIRRNSDGESVLRFYWLDAFEDPIRIPGTVYLFGKLMNGGTSESCCVVVKNIWRQIFFLPREKV